MSGPHVAPPQAAYLHVPFCRHRCGYCNFTLVANRDELMEAYLRALALELQALQTPRPVRTLFFGGGTPSHLPPALLERLLQLARTWFPWSDDAEVSLEANPADLDDDRLRLLADAGVNRLSVGVQSWQASKLAQLERDHTPQQVEQALARARPRMRSLAIDLIFAVPGESRADWRDDVRRTCDAAPDHVSTYGLTFERGTSFWSRRAHGRLQPLDEEAERWMYEHAMDTLSAAGWEHYEVSNFARAGHRCRHNEVYWSGQTYYAAGPGAARYVDGRREMNHRSTTTYLKRLFAGQSPVADSEQLDAADRARERLVFGLRRLEGIALTSFALETGYTVEQLTQPALDNLLTHGLLEQTGDRLRLTRAGLLVSDAIWPHFLQR